MGHFHSNSAGKGTEVKLHDGLCEQQGSLGTLEESRNKGSEGSGFWVPC